MKNIVYLLTLLMVSLIKTDPRYEVISCPGSMENYNMLTSILNQSGANKTTLDKKLKAWYSKSDLNKRIKVVVTFKSSDGKIWKWCMNKANKTSDFFESTLTPAASRDTGILPRIGDQQRCFFTDTTLIIDNFAIPAGSFSRDDLITLTIEDKRYFLLFNESKHEYYIPSTILERIPKSQYLDTRAKLNNEAFHFKLYLFSKEEYNDLTHTLANTSKSINCSKLPNYITDYLFDNWGKKSCTNSTAYANRLKIEIKKMIIESDIKCDHE